MLVAGMEELELRMPGSGEWDEWQSCLALTYLCSYCRWINIFSCMPPISCAVFRASQVLSFCVCFKATVGNAYA